LYTRPQLEAVLLRERARSDRNRCEFSLILFRVRADDQRMTHKLGKLLLLRIRAIDELGWFDDTCIAALLPYTGGEGAGAFAESTLKIAQEELVPTVCRIYTYPSAWYFDDEGKNGNGNGERAKVATRPVVIHAHGNDNGNGNGNSHGHNGNGNGHSHHANGNGNGNGNAHAKGNGNGHHHHEAPATRELASADLIPYVARGITDTLEAPDAGNDSVELLLVRKLPWWKRAIDIAGAGIGLLIFSPIMIISAIAIKGTSRGPVIFKQRRAGLGGQPFWIYKFRTMVTDAEAKKAELRKISEQDGPAFKLTNDPRVTSVGKILRETSLDELPQLWNVLKGDMSLVGPRPLPMDESAGCDQWQRTRLDVTPGLTCIWQVKGRSRVTFDEWMRMDVNYIRRRNFLHDVKILSQTIPAVLLRKGAR
jgi:lipopolysaccharide/colanic/teichoic acid biosynthesis glycosyltransferase